MRELKFIVDGQKLTKSKECDFENIVRGTNNYLRLTFFFSREWSGMVKVVEITNVSGVKVIEPLSGNTFAVPGIVTGDSIIKVKLYGMNKKGDQIVTDTMIINQS